jgi:hypothetical protein
MTDHRAHHFSTFKDTYEAIILEEVKDLHRLLKILNRRLERNKRIKIIDNNRRENAEYFKIPIEESDAGYAINYKDTVKKVYDEIKKQCKDQDINIDDLIPEEDILYNVA